MSKIGFGQTEEAAFAGPGHWNDPDMLVVGWVGWGPSLHPTRLSPDEQYTHISLWSLLAAPLLIGCDLERLDPFTLNLLTNDEVLAVDQDPLGKQAVPVVKSGDIQVWARDLEGGSKAVGDLQPRKSDGCIYARPLSSRNQRRQSSPRPLASEKSSMDGWKTQPPCSSARSGAAAAVEVTEGGIFPIGDLRWFFPVRLHLPHSRRDGRGPTSRSFAPA